MGLYQDFKKEKTASGGGLYAEYQKSIQPKQSFGQKAKGVIGSIINYGKEALKPSQESLNYERQVLPDYYKGDSKILKALTFPGTATARGIQKTLSRTILPGLFPLAKDVSEIYEVSKKGGVIDQVSKGNLPPEVLNDFEVLQKSNPQIAGDVAQAVLTFWAPKPITGVAKEGFKQPLKQTLKNAAIEGGALGGMFGGATIASSGDYSAENIAQTLGVSTVVGAGLSAIISGAVPATKQVQKNVRDFINLKYLEGIDNFPRKLNVKSEPGTFNVNVSTPKTRMAEYSKTQGYEPYLKESEIPTIEMGNKPKDTSGLPVIQAEPSTPKVKGDLEYIPETVSSIIEQGKKSPKLIEQAKSAATPDEIIRPTPKQVPVEGEIITPALATRAEAAAIEKNLVTRFEGLPEAKTMNMKQQASEAAALVANDYNRAKRIAMGQETPPGELRDASVFEAVKQRAIKENDVDTLKKLATESTIPSKLTAYGQEIKAADSSLVDSTDPVELMQEVLKSREKMFEKRSKSGVKIEKTKTVNEIKEKIKKYAPSKDDWNNFINNIEC